jgi:hypothetical protein
MSTITLSAFLVTLLVSHIIPLFTSLITKAHASTTVKQIATAFLSAIAAFITSATTLDGTAIFSTQSAVLALATFAFSQLSYVAIFKPRGINAYIAPSFGFAGSKSPY